jgi:hypothetical protein
VTIFFFVVLYVSPKCWEFGLTWIRLTEVPLYIRTSLPLQAYRRGRKDTECPIKAREAQPGTQRLPTPRNEDDASVKLEQWRVPLETTASLKYEPVATNPVL